MLDRLRQKFLGLKAAAAEKVRVLELSCTVWFMSFTCHLRGLP